MAGPSLGFSAGVRHLSPRFAKATVGLADVAVEGLVGAEYATGIGELKFAYDTVTFGAGLAMCAAGAG